MKCMRNIMSAGAMIIMDVVMAVGFVLMSSSMSITLPSPSHTM